MHTDIVPDERLCLALRHLMQVDQGQRPLTSYAVPVASNPAALIKQYGISDHL